MAIRLYALLTLKLFLFFKNKIKNLQKSTLKNSKLFKK